MGQMIIVSGVDWRTRTLVAKKIRLITGYDIRSCPCPYTDPITSLVWSCNAMLDSLLNAGGLIFDSFPLVDDPIRELHLFTKKALPLRAPLSDIYDDEWRDTFELMIGLRPLLIDCQPPEELAVDNNNNQESVKRLHDNMTGFMSGIQFNFREMIRSGPPCFLPAYNLLDDPECKTLYDFLSQHLPLKPLEKFVATNYTFDYSRYVKNEWLRLSYQPTKTRVLFIGESAPVNGTFFYRANSHLFHAMRNAFTVTGIGAGMEGTLFLDEFKNNLFFLDDLGETPDDAVQMANHVGDRIRRHSPSIIVTLIKRISPIVRSVSDQIGYHGSLYDLPCPVQGHQRKFFNGLVDILTTTGPFTYHNPIRDEDGLTIWRTKCDEISSILYPISTLPVL